MNTIRKLSVLSARGTPSAYCWQASEVVVIATRSQYNTARLIGVTPSPHRATSGDRRLHSLARC